MSRAKNLAVGHAILVLCGIGLIGCNQESQIQQTIINNPSEMLAFLMEGYSNEYPGLFCDDSLTSKTSRLRQLIDALGFTDYHYQGVVKADGNELWVSKGFSDRESLYDEVLVLSATKPPQVKRVLLDTIYNLSGEEIGKRFKDEKNQVHIRFNNGVELKNPGPYQLDASGLYLCQGGHGYRCPDGSLRNEPVLVFSIDALGVPLYQSKLTSYPEGIYHVNGELVVIAQSHNPPGGLDVECVQKLEGGKWAITEQYAVVPPAIFAVQFMRLLAFDPTTKNMVVFVKQKWPLDGKTYFYDYGRKKLVSGSFLDKPARYFLKPEVLSNSVQYMIEKYGTDENGLESKGLK